MESAVRASGEIHHAAGETAAAEVPLIDVTRQYSALRHEIQAAINRICEAGQFVLGPDCRTLEERLARYCGAPHAIACASGSDALLLALMACGVGPGDEVLVPSFTFFATAGAVSRLGAVPVFVDIDPATFNIDHRQIAARITRATKAIIPVHLYGQCAEMQPICELGRERGLAVIEDAAQAIGAEYRGVRAGALAELACFSFYPTKNLGGFGDGGLLTTLDGDLAARLKILRVHGGAARYVHQVVGINSRLDTIQAAVLNIKLDHLERWTLQRQAHAERYFDLFSEASLTKVLTLPRPAPGRRHVWNQYVVRVPDGRRDALRDHLTRNKIGTQIYYPIPLHRQECFSDLGYEPGSLPESERAARETLALPIFPEMTIAEQQAVVRQIASFFGARATGKAQPMRAPKFLRAGSTEPV